MLETSCTTYRRDCCVRIQPEMWLRFRDRLANDSNNAGVSPTDSQCRLIQASSTSIHHTSNALKAESMLRGVLCYNLCTSLYIRCNTQFRGVVRPVPVQKVMSETKPSCAHSDTFMLRGALALARVFLEHEGFTPHVLCMGSSE